MKRVSAFLNVYLYRLPSATASLILVIAVFATFLPVRRFDYLAIDDKMHTEQNVRISPFTWQNLKSFWVAPYENAYTPLTYSTWMVAAASARSGADSLRRFDPGIFHLTNLTFHALATIGVFFLLLSLCGNRVASLTGAFFFAFHPLQVESVSWITGLRDVMAGAFSIFAGVFYFQFQKRTGRTRFLLYLAGIAFYLAAVLCKSSALVTPLILALFSFAILKRRPRTLFFELAPWVILSLPFLYIFVSLNNGVSKTVVYSPSIFGRVIIAIDSFSFYLRKVFFPYPLMMDYGRTPQWVLFRSPYPWTLATTTLAIALTFWAAKRKRAYWLPLCLLLFLVALSPLLGFQSFIFQHISTVADRYAYLAMLSPAFAIAWVLAQHRNSHAFLVAGMALMMCWLVTMKQIPVWRNNETLFSHNLKYLKGSWLASNNLGAAYEMQGKWEAAKELYFQAAQLSNIPSAWNNFGAMALKSKDYATAITAFRNALHFSERSHWASLNLSTAYALAGQRTEAKVYLSESLKKNPYSIFAQENWEILERQGPVSSLKILRASGDDS